MSMLNNFSKKPNVENFEIVLLDFLEAISNVYKNSMVLKGCMCLKLQLSLDKQIRGTSDLDMHFFTLDDWEDFVNMCCPLANKYSTRGIKYELVSRRGFRKNPNSDSLKFKATLPNGEIYDFKLDMNIGNCNYKDSIVLPNGVSINVNSVLGIMIDKLQVLSSIKVCRRVKDLIDVYYLITNFDFDYDEIFDIMQTKTDLIDSMLTDGCFILMDDKKDLIKNAFDKYQFLNGEKPEFEEVYNLVMQFSETIYGSLCVGRFSSRVWSKEEREWKANI